VLRHRLLLTYEAEARDLTSDDLIIEIFDTVDVP
jgi:MoxR-like ATPase